MDATTAVSLLNAGLAHCVVAIEEDQGLIASLFLAGLVGGVTHCAGMCGPFVLAQTTARLESIPVARMSELHRLRGAALLPYHGGRAVTYMGLGTLAAAAGGGITGLQGLSWAPAAFLALAALFFLFHGLRGILNRLGFAGFSLNPWRAAGARAVVEKGRPSVVSRLSALIRPLFRNPTGWRGFLLGLALGFIPCGLLYGAIAAAAASGNPFTGAIGLAAFALGTVPTLFGVGLAGHVAGRTAAGAVAFALPAIMMVNAVVLGTFAWRLLVA